MMIIDYDDDPTHLYHHHHHHCLQICSAPIIG